MTLKLQIADNVEFQAGGKVESAQGVGVNGSKANEALQLAIDYFNQKV